MCEKDLPPLFFTIILVLHSSFRYFIKFNLSPLVNILKLQFLLYHHFQISQMHLTLISFFFQLSSQLLIDFVCTIFPFIKLMSLFLVDVELLCFAVQYLFHVKFLLVIENFIGFMAPLHINQNFLLSCRYFQQTLLFLQFIL